MWQRCPVCNGSQVDCVTDKKCKTCDGKGIINVLTGFPPSANIINNHPKDKQFDIEEELNKLQTNLNFTSK